MDSVRATLMISTAGLISVPARLVGGLLADRVGKQYMRLLTAGNFLLIAAGIISYQLTQTIAMAQIFLILFYIGFAGGMPLYTAIVARYFGRMSIGSIQGIANLIMMPFGVLAPIYVGWVYDRYGSYSNAFNLFVGLLLLAAVLLVFARPPKPPVQASNVDNIL